MKNTFLKVTSILMIIGGVCSLLLSIVTVVSVAEDKALAKSLGADTTLIDLAIILMFVISILQLLAGIIGVATAGKGKKAMPCIILGIVLIILAAVSFIILMQIEAVRVTDYLSFVLPALYLISAFVQKKFEGKAPGQIPQPATYGQPMQPGPYGQPAPQAPAQPYGQPAPQAPAAPVEAAAQPIADATTAVEESNPEE